MHGIHKQILLLDQISNNGVLENIIIKFGTGKDKAEAEKAAI